MHLADSRFCSSFVSALLLIVSIPGIATGNTSSIRHILDISGSRSESLSLPTDVAVTHDRVCVVDGGNHRLAVFNIQGRFLFYVGGKGSSEGRFLSPTGVGTDADGRIYVADSDNHRVQIFNLDGTFLSSFPVNSSGQKVRPIDIAVNQKRDLIYITGNTNHKVMVFGGNGRLIREWGGNGAETGEFRYPATIALLPDQRVSVVDVLNTRVQVFEESGVFSINVGEWGVLPGQLFRPKGVAADEQGRFYISDSYMNVIQVFSDIGRFMHVLKVVDPAHEMSTPTGIAVANDRLYVAELLANKVSVFQLVE